MRATSYAVGVRANGARRYLGTPTWWCPAGLRRTRGAALQFDGADLADRQARALAANNALVTEVTLFRVDTITRGGRTGQRWHALTVRETRAAGAAVAVGPETSMLAGLGR